MRFLRKRRFKNYIAVFFLITLILLLDLEIAGAESVSIKGAMKIHRMGGYVILITYETYERWTDNLLFRVHCQFDEGEFIFTSGSIDNLERGWHKTEVAISDVVKKRYGSLREYKVELYRNGMLVDTKNSY